MKCDARAEPAVVANNTSKGVVVVSRRSAIQEVKQLLRLTTPAREKELLASEAQHKR